MKQLNASSPYLTFLERRLDETRLDVIPLKRLRIRTASPTDLNGICLIEDDSFRSPYPPDLLKRLLHDHGNNFLVAEEASGKPVGYCVAAIEGRLAHVVSIAVLPEHRKKGVATALLQNLIENLGAHGVDELWLEVNTGNKEAITLYEKFGFARMMILENYYSDGAPALRMRLRLNEQVLRVGRNEG